MEEGQSHAVPSRLKGTTLTLVRVLWVLLVIVTLGYYITILPNFVDAIQPHGLADVISPFSLLPDSVAALESIGISVSQYAQFVVLVNSAGVILSTIIGSIMFVRRSDDWMVILVSAFVILFAALNVSSTAQVSASNTIFLRAGEVLNGFTWVLFLLFLFLFPDGRFVPRALIPLAVLEILFSLLLNINPDPIRNLLRRLPFGALLFGSIILTAWVSGIFSQFYRYHRVSNEAQRRQIKWVVYGIGILLLTAIPAFIPFLFFSSRENLSQIQALWFLLLGLVAPLFGVIIAASLGIAMLRSHLYDIDLIIRRTVIYSTITALLAGMYFGAVALLQDAFVQLTGQRSPAALVISTLAIAALFTPLRRRVQNFVDRRFNRRRYNAEQTLEAFAEAMRDDVDMDHLSAALIGVVEETMQPESVSLWLAPPSQEA